MLNSIFSYKKVLQYLISKIGFRSAALGFPSGFPLFPVPRCVFWELTFGPVRGNIARHFMLHEVARCFLYVKQGRRAVQCHILQRAFDLHYRTYTERWMLGLQHHRIQEVSAGGIHNAHSEDGNG